MKYIPKIIISVLKRLQNNLEVLLENVLPMELFEICLQKLTKKYLGD